MIRFPAPTDVHGDLLAQQLADAGIPSRVAVSGQNLELMDLEESAWDAAQVVVSAHAAEARAAQAADAAEVANAATIRDRAAQALSTNSDFLALASPTNAQTLAQVKALTRQINGLIRLTLGRLDGTD